MTTKGRQLTLLFGFIGLLLVLVVFLVGPGNPSALLRVVDPAGKPVAGVVIRPEGLRTKPGPYSGGWYGWNALRMGVSTDPVTTDANGYASLRYPKFVFEHIETGTICLRVEHPDFVPDRPERVVSFGPPARAPWRVWLDYLVERVQHKIISVRPDPITLQKGAILRLKARASSQFNGPLFAQVGGLDDDSHFWVRPAPDELVTKRLRPGPTLVRAIRFDTNRLPWFSPVTNITAVAGQTTQIEFELNAGFAVHGKIDETVARPVRNGRVIANVWPRDEKPSNHPPTWHAWSKIREDGTFEVGPLPEGKLELVALCDGYVSTNGPGQFPTFHYPQVYDLGTNNLEVVLGMERACGLEVLVTDDQGKPLKDAHVSAWPNVRYGEWSATGLGSDCYNTADFISDSQRESLMMWWANHPPTYLATSDVAGIALLANLPREANEFSIVHPQFAMPAKEDQMGRKSRQANMTLSRGQTNRVTVQLEPAGRSQIAHY